MRTTAPSTVNSTREIPFLSADEDWTATSSPSRYELPLGGAEMMTMGLLPLNDGTASHAGSTMAATSRISNIDGRTKRVYIFLLPFCQSSFVIDWQISPKFCESIAHRNLIFNPHINSPAIVYDGESKSSIGTTIPDMAIVLIGDAAE